MSDKSTSLTLTAEVGTEMQLEIAGLSHRFKLRMVGLLPPQYLLFHIPRKVFDTVGSAAFALGLPVNVRCISRGAAFGFHSSIVHVNQVPNKLLFLEYPESLQKHIIRKNQRVKCLLPARASQDAISVAGTIADISRSGCHFQAKKEDFGTEQAILAKSGESISVSLALPGIEGFTAIDAIVKNFAMDVEKVQIGLEFTQVSDKILKNLDEFVAMSFDLAPF